MEFGKTSDFECNSAMQKLKMPTLRNTSAIVLSATDDSFASNCWKISLVLLTSMSQACFIKIQKVPLLKSLYHYNLLYNINSLINMITTENFDTVTSITNTSVLENQLKNLLNRQFLIEHQVQVFQPMSRFQIDLPHFVVNVYM